MNFKRCNKFSRPANEFEAFDWAMVALHEALVVVGNASDVAEHHKQGLQHAIDTTVALAQYHEDMLADKVFASPKPEWRGQAPDDVDIGTRQDAALRSAFDYLAYSYVTDIRLSLSSSHEPHRKHPAYKAMVAMGSIALPWILEFWAEHPDSEWWGVVLEPILTAEARMGPVIPESDYGRYAAIREHWLKWGRDNGFLKNADPQ